MEIDGWTGTEKADQYSRRRSMGVSEFVLTAGSPIKSDLRSESEGFRGGFEPIQDVLRPIR